MPEAVPQAVDGQAAVKKLANDEPTAAVERSAALDWFLNPDPEVDDRAWDDIDVNVGGPAGSGREKVVRFKIAVVDRERIRELRRQCEHDTPSGREVNDTEANTLIALEGLLDPPVKSDPKLLTVRGQTFLDPADALRARFAHKSGLIDQIAGKIVELSGYGDKDVMEVKAGKR